MGPQKARLGRTNDSLTRAFWGPKWMLKIGLLRRFANLLSAARFVVQGDSMVPTLENGQYILVSKLAYLLSNPSRGDVVVLRHPDRNGRTYIKRIVGLPGDQVNVEVGDIYIDGNILGDLRRTEDAALWENGDLGATIGPRDPLDQGWILKENQYFVAGDNRSASDDSRTFGPVDRNMILGKAWVRYWPRSSWKILD